MKTITIILAAIALAFALPACDSGSKKDDGHTDHTH